MTLRSLPTALFAMLLTLGAAPGDAAAQRNDLPIQIITAGDLTPEQIAQITRFVESNTKLMESDDTSEVRRGRVALLTPVDNRDPTASVVFRLKYGEIAAPHLSRVASGQGEIQAINALIVAGAIATTRTAEVLNTGQQDQRIAVRFGAFAAVKRVFRAIEQYSPAISEEDAISLARRVAGRMAEEADPQVFDAGVKALLQATEIRRQRFERLPMAAWKCLSEGVGQKVRQLPCNAEGSAFLPAVRRSGAAIGAAAARMHAEFQRDPDTSKAVFELGADAWVFVLRCIEDGNAAPLNPQDQPEAADAKRAHREMLAGVVVEGRDLMVFSVRAIGANAAVFESKDPAEWVREGSAERDRTFTKRVNDLLGPGGVAKDPPLSYPPNRFIKK